MENRMNNKNQSVYSKDNTNEQKNWLYSASEPVANDIKVALQFLVALVIVGVIIVKISLSIAGVEYNDDMFYVNDPKLIIYLANNNLLLLVGQALAVSASIELAYMLFTPGPDEAIDPVILGIAAAALVALSENNPHWEDAILVLSFSVGLYILFHLRSKLGIGEVSEKINKKNRFGKRSVVLTGVFLIIVIPFLVSCFNTLPKTKSPCLKYKLASKMSIYILREFELKGVTVCSIEYNKSGL